MRLYLIRHGLTLPVKDHNGFCRVAVLEDGDLVAWFTNSADV